MFDNFGRKVNVPEMVPKDWKPGWNKNRRKCKKFQYRGLSSGGQKWFKNMCDYIEHARHSRGCKVEDCFRFVRGNRLKINTHSGKDDEYAD